MTLRRRKTEVSQQQAALPVAPTASASAKPSSQSASVPLKIETLMLAAQEEEDDYSDPSRLRAGTPSFWSSGSGSTATTPRPHFDSPPLTPRNGEEDDPLESGFAYTTMRAGSPTFYSHSVQSKTEKRIVFAPKDFSEVKATSSDIYFLIISDKNPLFNEQTIKALVDALQKAGVNTMVVMPTGSLQWSTISLNMALQGKKVDEEKAKLDGKQTESQNVTKLLRSFIISELGIGLESERWKPTHDIRHSPPTQAAQLTKKVEALVDKLAKEDATLQCKKINGYYDVPQQAVRSQKNKIKNLASDIQGVIGAQLRQRATKIPAKQTHSQGYNLADDLIDKAYSNKKRLILMQWQAIADERNLFPPYQREQDQFNQRLKVASSHFKKNFADLVNTVTDKLLHNFCKKHSAQIKVTDQASWKKSNLEVARNYVQIYLSAEIPFFNLIINTAFEAYQKSRVQSNSTELHLKICYPFESSVGHDIFAFLVDCHQESMRIFPEAVEFLSTTKIMLKAQLEEDNELTALPASQQNKKG